MGVAFGPGYPLQVLATDRRGCGLSTAIPNAGWWYYLEMTRE